MYRDAMNSENIRIWRDFFVKWTSAIYETKHISVNLTSDSPLFRAMGRLLLLRYYDDDHQHHYQE